MREILALIYMRTLLMIAEDDLTPTMRKIMAKCTEVERKLYARNKKLYMQCTEIAKEVWPRVKDGKKDYTIHIEPAVCDIYYSVEKELTKLKFKKTNIDRIYDKYFHTSKCDLEHKSRMLGSEIWEITQQVMLERVDIKGINND